MSPALDRTHRHPDEGEGACILLVYPLSSVYRAGGAGARAKDKGMLRVFMALTCSASLNVC